MLKAQEKGKIKPVNFSIEWLQTVRQHIVDSSIPWRHLRHAAVSELKSRLSAQLFNDNQAEKELYSSPNIPHNKPLRDWTLEERNSLANSVEETIKQSIPQLYVAVQESVNEILQGHFNLNVHNRAILNSKHLLDNDDDIFGKLKKNKSTGKDLIEAKVY